MKSKVNSLLRLMIVLLTSISILGQTMTTATNITAESQVSTVKKQIRIPASILSITDPAHRQAAAQLYVDFPRIAFADYIHKPLKAERMRFDNRPWMDELYMDQADKIVVVKSSKTGVTEWALCDMFSMAHRGLSGMYVLPDEAVRNRFITTRFDSIIPRVKEYRDNFRLAKKAVDAKGLKTMYDSTWAFVGSKTKMYEFNADCMIYDEYDQCDEIGLAYGQDRTLGATKDIWRKIGNPTVAGQGIALEYEESDQKKWLIKCSHCNTWQQLDWFVNFVRKEDNGLYSLLGTDGPGDAYPVCSDCEGRLARLSNGQWVAEYPDRSISGYDVSRLFGFPGNDDPDHTREVIRETFESFRKAHGNPTLMQRLYNNILGIVYANSDESLTHDVLQGCAGDFLTTDKYSCTRLVAGIDQGKDNHVIISEMIAGVAHVRFIGHFQTLEEVDAVLDTMGVTYACIDAQGGSWAQTREWVSKKSGRYMCYFRPKDQVKKLYDPDHKTGVINCNRTEICDTNVQSYKQKKVVIPQDWLTIDNGQFKKQMTVPQRIFDPSGRPIWTKGNDHYFFADVYRHVAMLVSGMSNSNEVTESWRV